MVTPVRIRQAKVRARKRAEGLRKYEIWLHPAEWLTLRAQLQEILVKRRTPEPPTPL